MRHSALYAPMNDNRKKVGSFVVVVALFVGGGLGYLCGLVHSKTDGVVTYDYPIGGGMMKIAFHRSQPTYGLPLMEYSRVLKHLSFGNTNAAREDLCIFLEWAISDAEHRTLVVDQTEAEAIARAVRMGRQCLAANLSWTNGIVRARPRAEKTAGAGD